MMQQIKNKEGEGAHAQPSVQRKQNPSQKSPYLSHAGKKGPIQAKQRPVNKSNPEPRTIDPFEVKSNPAVAAYQQQMASHYGGGLGNEASPVQLKGSTSLQANTRPANINDDPKLEKEADVMGAKAMQLGQTSTTEPVQKKEATPNQTGLPDHLKTGIENLSGQSMDDVKVHYNSEKPAQLQAHAYAQGTDIHIGPGQEKHLPHEAWHVVQQKEGRVKSNKQEQDSPHTPVFQLFVSRQGLGLPVQGRDDDIIATIEEVINALPPNLGLIAQRRAIRENIQTLANDQEQEYSLRDIMDMIFNTLFQNPPQNHHNQENRRPVRVNHNINFQNPPQNHHNQENRGPRGRG